MEMDEALQSLFNSIRDNDMDNVEVLLRNGTSPNSAIGYMSALGAAVNANHTGVCEMLISAGADVNFGGRGGQFPLYTAAKKGNIQLIQSLIKSGAKLDLKYMNGNTALLEATHKGHDLVMKELIKAGADVKATNNGGDSGLHIAAALGNIDMVMEYLSAGVDVDMVKMEGPRQVSNTGIRPLHMAAYGPMGGHAHIAEILLNHGADVDAEMASGRTTLHIAAMRNGQDIADVLLRHGCSLEPVSMENDEHKTPLMKAVDNGHLAMVEKLVRAGADINTVDIWGVTPLISAIFSGKELIAKLLMKYGCDLDKASKSGMTPFQASLRHGPSMTRLLLQAGCRRGPPFDSLIAECDSESSKLSLDERRHLLVLLQTPLSLQQICRLVFRHNYCGNKCADKINSFVLPHRLKDYLLFKDLDDVFV